MHAYIISSLKKEMPSVFGKESKKSELIRDLEKIYTKIHNAHVRLAPLLFSASPRLSFTFTSIPILTSLYS